MINKKIPKTTFDVIVIGGGFYGCTIALFLKKIFPRIAVIESTPTILSRASTLNQARVHNGYHYPRSLLTAMRSHINYQKFTLDYADAILKNFRSFYAISAINSKSNAKQFFKFCSLVNIPLIPPATGIKKLFNSRMIEEIFEVEESIFNAAKLASLLRKKLDNASVYIFTSTKVVRISQGKNDALMVHLDDGHPLTGRFVFNCTYSKVNTLLRNSNLLCLPLKHELTEIALVRVPMEFTEIGITVMDGPFFSLMPFPARGIHSLTHVRYTPHYSWSDVNKPQTIQQKAKLISNFIYMYKDAQRFMPILKNLSYDSSLYETKTVLLDRELDDGRPILLRKDYGLKNFYIVLGGKMDNIYDVLESLTEFFQIH